MTCPSSDPSNPYRQKGMVLIVSLIFLLLLTILSITTMRTNIIEEKLAGNSRDSTLALQAAEAALRDAELDIQSGNRFIGEAGFDTSCSNGLCIPQIDGSAIWIDLANSNNPGWMYGADAGPSIKYGTYTSPNPATVNGVAYQPRYIIEVITERGGTLTQKGGYGNQDNQYVYRVTARGFGATVDNNGNPVSQVTLQSIYKP